MKLSVVWRSAFFLFISVILINLASYLRAAITGSIKVDQNYPEGTGMLMIVCLYFISLGMAGFGYYKVVLRKKGWDLTPGQTRTLALTAAVLSFFMLPMISNDIFGVIAYADLALKGISPYIDGSLLVRSDFYGYVGDVWKDAPCVYGPFNLLITMSAVFPAQGNLFWSLFLYKLLILGFSVAFIFFICRYIEHFGGHQRYNIAALLVFCPILWLHGSGHAHNDIVAAALVAAAVYYLKTEKYLSSCVLLTLAVLSKTISVILFAFYFIWLAYRHRGAVKKLALLYTASLLIIITVSFAAYYPFWQGSQTVTGPLHFLADKNPTRSPVEILSAGFAYIEGGYSSLETMAEKGPEGWWKSTEERQRFWAKKFQPAFQIFGLLLAFLMLIKLRQINGLRYGRILEIFGAITIIAICFYSQVSYPWYLLMALPLFMETSNRAWISWWIAISVWSNTENIVHVIGPGRWITPFVAPFSVFTIVALYFWKFRERFLWK